jgi:hypothetical protein
VRRRSSFATLAWCRAALLCVGGAALLGAASSPSTEILTAPSAIGNAFAVTRDDLATVTRGQPLVRVVPSEDLTEVVTIAGVSLRAHADVVARCAATPGCLRERAESSCGRTGLLPDAAQFEGLSLDGRDLLELRSCRPGRCDLRLPEEAIRELAAEAPKPKDSPGKDVLFRRFLAGRARAYRELGHAGLSPYADRPEGNDPARGLELILGRPLPGLESEGELRAYLLDGTRARPASVIDEHLAWYREHVFRKSVVSLEHVVVARRVTPEEDRVLVVTKKIYATHYFEAAVEVAEFVRRRGETEGRLVVAVRSRTDVRRSGFHFIERLLLRRLVKGRIATELSASRRRLLDLSAASL